MSPLLRRAPANPLGAIFNALAHSVRRRILSELRAAHGALTAGAIAERMLCSPSSTSRHLNVLRRAGLVRVERRAQTHVYRLDPDHLLEQVAVRWLENIAAHSRHG
jgi:DNA-binding transcriptional ArsR family regulator